MHKYIMQYCRTNGSPSLLFHMALEWHSRMTAATVDVPQLTPRLYNIHHRGNVCCSHYIVSQGNMDRPSD